MKKKSERVYAGIIGGALLGGMTGGPAWAIIGGLAGYLVGAMAS